MGHLLIYLWRFSTNRTKRIIQLFWGKLLNNMSVVEWWLARRHPCFSLLAHDTPNEWSAIEHFDGDFSCGLRTPSRELFLTLAAACSDILSTLNHQPYSRLITSSTRNKFTVNLSSTNRKWLDKRREQWTKIVVKKTKSVFKCVLMNFPPPRNPRQSDPRTTIHHSNINGFSTTCLIKCYWFSVMIQNRIAFKTVRSRNR